MYEIVFKFTITGVFANVEWIGRIIVFVKVVVVVVHVVVVVIVGVVIY